MFLHLLPGRYSLDMDDTVGYTCYVRPQSAWLFSRFGHE